MIDSTILIPVLVISFLLYKLFTFKDTGFASGLVGLFWLILLLLFIAIWGGIFWW